MKVLDLFSGIGGFSLGLERAGMRTVAFCEIDAYCRRVLAKHWPNVPCYDDIRTLTAERLAADGISVDLICGGFPCQDISNAGKRAGIGGARSGLWSEYARLIGEIRPRYVIVENVAALLGRGLERVLGDLAALGFDAEWHCIPASAVGAPHRRDRLWIVAFNTNRLDVGAQRGIHSQDAYAGRVREAAAGSNSAPMFGASIFGSEPNGDHAGLGEMADACRAGLPDIFGGEARAKLAWDGTAGRCRWWDVEPDVGRVAHGVPSRVDRLRSLGNAVVPQIPEIIGRAILQAEMRAA